MNRPLLWITGAGGLIGSHLVQSAPRALPDWEARGLERRRLDLTDFAAGERRFAEEKPDAIIHCAAITRPAVCQAQPALARQMNVEVTAVLAGLAADRPFVFFSTDLVFDGLQGNYTEDAPTHPLTVYAETKEEAERIVLVNPKHSVVRTSLNGGISPTGDRGFNEELRRAWAAGREVRLFTDEFRNPLPALVTARAVWEWFQEQRPGLYHLAGAEKLSRFELGRLVAARAAELNPRIEPCSLRTYKGPPRAPDSTLNCDKIQALLSFRLPGLSEWLDAHPGEPF
jgi:dTDP-4-dehydrorhamnose reductase